MKTFYLFGVVSQDNISDRLIQSYLDSAKNDELQFYVNSPGGSYTQGIAIYNLLSANSNNKIMKIMGEASSAMSLIVQGATKRLIAPTAHMWIHNAQLSFDEGNTMDSNDLKKNAEEMEKLNITMNEIYQKRTGLSFEKIKKIMDDETLLTAEEAVKLRFVDEIFNPKNDEIKNFTRFAALNKNIVAPYPNEHSARIRDPGDFRPDTFRRKTISEGVSIIIGKLTSGGDSMVTQAYRFVKSKFTPEQAKAWLKEHDIKYILFENAGETQTNIDDIFNNKEEDLKMTEDIKNAFDDVKNQIAALKPDSTFAANYEVVQRQMTALSVKLDAAETKVEKLETDLEKAQTDKNTLALKYEVLEKEKMAAQLSAFYAEEEAYCKTLVAEKKMLPKKLDAPEGKRAIIVEKLVSLRLKPDYKIGEKTAYEIERAELAENVVLSDIDKTYEDLTSNDAPMVTNWDNPQEYKAAVKFIRSAQVEDTENSGKGKEYEKFDSLIQSYATVKGISYTTAYNKLTQEVI